MGFIINGRKAAYSRDTGRVNVCMLGNWFSTFVLYVAAVSEWWICAETKFTSSCFSICMPCLCHSGCFSFPLKSHLVPLWKEQQRGENRIQMLFQVSVATCLSILNPLPGHSLCTLQGDDPPNFLHARTHSTKTMHGFSFVHQVPLLPGFQGGGGKLYFIELSITFPCSEWTLFFVFRLPPLPVQLQSVAELKFGLIHLSLTSHFGQLFRRIQTNNCATAKKTKGCSWLLLWQCSAKTSYWGCN